MVQARRWKDGRDLYTQALEVLRNKSQGQQPDKHLESSELDLGQKTEKEVDAQQEKVIEEACCINRALCNLELSKSASTFDLVILYILSQPAGLTPPENFRSTTLDCAATLRLNPSNVKAFYRSSLALLALDKLAEATDSCTRGLTLDPSNTAFNILHSKIQARTNALASESRVRAEKASRLLKEKQTLTAALLARGIETRTTASPPSLEDATIQLSPDPLSPASTLVFPLLILYPLDAQSDFIKAVPETDTLPLHLEYIFPLPWDIRGEYHVGNVEFYMETGKEGGGLVKVGPRVSLLEVLGGGKVVVVDGVVRVNVLVKGKAGPWIEEVKARRGR